MLLQLEDAASGSCGGKAHALGRMLRAGLPVPDGMDGRVLHEALVPSKEAPPKVNVKKIEANRASGLFRWKQYLQFSEVNGTVYFDEGNGEAEPK